MRVEEIAMRQEIRQLLSEAGLNRESIRQLAEQVLKEEVEKQVKHVFNSTNTAHLIRKQFDTYEFRDAMKNAVAREIREQIRISVDAKVDRLKGE